MWAGVLHPHPSGLHRWKVQVLSQPLILCEPLPTCRHNAPRCSVCGMSHSRSFAGASACSSCSAALGYACDVASTTPAGSIWYVPKECEFLFELVRPSHYARCSRETYIGGEQVCGRGRRGGGGRKAPNRRRGEGGYFAQTGAFLPCLALAHLPAPLPSVLLGSSAVVAATFVRPATRGIRAVPARGRPTRPRACASVSIPSA
jgi:hypothetical protein